MPAIIVEQLSKVYRYHRKEPGLRGSLRSLVRRRMLENVAVDAVSFTIEPGEMVGFLGPNGAGKTTTLKMLSGLLYPSGGSASVLGYTPSQRRHAFLRRIALVMGQKNMLMWDIPAMETLLLHKEMYGLEERDFRRTVAELSEILAVEQLLGVQVRKLSLGERMKMELLAALVHNPDVLFLDEPTIGLDVVSQARIRDALRDLNLARGTTILLTSHYMDDIETLCPRVLVIDRGRLRFDGSLAGLVARSAPHKRIHVTLSQALRIEEARDALDCLSMALSDDGQSLDLTVPRDRVADAASRLLRLGTVVDLTIEEVPVEEIVRDIFTGQEAMP